MMKRVLCVIMCCVIIAALSLSVFAAEPPRNDLAGNVVLSSITIYHESGTKRLTNINDTFSFGTYNYLDLYFSAGVPGSPEDLEEIYMYFDFDININNTSTIYIASSPISNFSYSLSDLSEYRYSDGDIEVTFPSGSYSIYDYQISASSSTSSNILANVNSSTRSQDVEFLCYKNVPAGTYNLTFSNDDVYTNILDSIISIGVYVTVPTVFEDFENGDITYDDAINDILDSIDDIIDDSTLSDTEKLVAIEVLKLDLIRIKEISDFKYNTVVSDFVDDSDSIIDDFVSGIANINDSIADLQMVYFNALSQAVNPEQGTYLNTAYQVQVSKLHLLWQIDFYDNLEQIVTDEKLDENSEKLSHLDELHAQEKEVLSNFELAEFESQLEFSLWTDALPYDYSNYRTIFEYLLEDNKAFQISQFLIVPFSLVLVSVLLATTTVVLRRNRNG